MVFLTCPMTVNTIHKMHTASQKRICNRNKTTCHQSFLAKPEDKDTDYVTAEDEDTSPHPLPGSRTAFPATNVWDTLREEQGHTDHRDNQGPAIRPPQRGQWQKGRRKEDRQENRDQEGRQSGSFGTTQEQSAMQDQKTNIFFYILKDLGFDRSQIHGSFVKGNMCNHSAEFIDPNRVRLHPEYIGSILKQSGCKQIIGEEYLTP